MNPFGASEGSYGQSPNTQKAAHFSTEAVSCVSRVGAVFEAPVLDDISATAVSDVHSRTWSLSIFCCLSDTPGAGFPEGPGKATAATAKRVVVRIKEGMLIMVNMNRNFETVRELRF